MTHYTHGALTTKQDVSVVNKLLLEDRITLEQYERAKANIIAGVAISHQPVVYNWFVV